MYRMAYMVCFASRWIEQQMKLLGVWSSMSSLRSNVASCAPWWNPFLGRKTRMRDNSTQWGKGSWKFNLNQRGGNQCLLSVGVVVVVFPALYKWMQHDISIISSIITFQILLPIIIFSFTVMIIVVWKIIPSSIRHTKYIRHHEVFQTNVIEY
jgi:hypothetical protein